MGGFHDLLTNNIYCGTWNSFIQVFVIISVRTMIVDVHGGWAARR